MQSEVNAQGVGVRAGYQTASIAYNGNQVAGSPGNFYLGGYKNIKFGVGDLSGLNTGSEYMEIWHRPYEANFRSINYLRIPFGLRAKPGPPYALDGINFKIGKKMKSIIRVL